MNKVPVNTRDYFLTQESFKLIFNEQYQCYQTDPVPLNLDTYYDSKAYISHTDGKKGWFEFLYQSAKGITLFGKKRLICKLFPEKKKLKVLDIGCGTGDFLKVLSKSYLKFGIEPSNLARELAERKNIRCYSSSDVVEEKFDLISMWHVLEHVPNLEKQFETFDRLLTTRGKILIAVPNYESYDAKYYGKLWAAYDVPRHLWHFSKKSIHTIANSKGYKIKKIVPMWLDSFYVAMLSEKYKKTSFSFFKGFFVGLVSNISALSSKNTSSLIYVLEKTI